jgi:hypothetical protein
LVLYMSGGLSPTAGNDVYLNNPLSNSIIFGTNGSERMRIDSSGNVGIGTTSPSAKLSVAGTATITGLTTLGSATATPIQIDRLSDSTTYGLITLNGALTNATAAGILGKGTGGDAGNLYYTSPTNHVFQIAAVEKMRIDSSGNLLVGTTSQLLSAMISVVPGASRNGLAFTMATGYESIITNNPSAAAYTFGDFRQNNTVVGTIAVGTTTTSYNITSDYRLKNSVTPMVGALAKVAALKPVTYKWKSDGSDGEGFIAHELAKVVPGCVTGDKDAVDSDGNPVYQGIDTSFLVATLTAAIQEQQALITSLTARIVALESN